MTDCWVYWIRLTWTPVVGNGLSTQPSPSVPVAVLMDGTAVLPSKIIKPLKEPEFTSRYRKLLRENLSGPLPSVRSGSISREIPLLQNQRNDFSIELHGPLAVFGGHYYLRKSRWQAWLVVFLVIMGLVIAIVSFDL
ncbi:MAG: hypothetical protein U0905_19160 [Pirellulales bacterium]